MEAQQAHIQFVSGHESTMCSMVCCSLQSQSGDKVRPHLCMLARTTRALAVQQCPGMAQVKTRLLDSRVAYKMTIDHSRRPVFFPLSTLVDRSCVCPDTALSYKSFLRVVKHFGINLVMKEWHFAFGWKRFHDSRMLSVQINMYASCDSTRHGLFFL